MSARGSTAKISSLSSMSLPAFAEAESDRFCTLTFILVFLALGRLRARGSGGGFTGVGRGAGVLLGGDRRDFLVTRESRDLVDRRLIDQARLRDVRLFLLQLLEDARRIGCALVTGELDGVGDRQPAALVARDRALDEQQAADRVGADHFEILLRAVPGAHVARHLLVLEDAARILAVAGRTVRAVRKRHAVGRAETAESPALHGAGKALDQRHVGDVDQLA